MIQEGEKYHNLDNAVFTILSVDSDYVTIEFSDDDYRPVRKIYKDFFESQIESGRVRKINEPTNQTD